MGQLAELLAQTTKDRGGLKTSMKQDRDRHQASQSAQTSPRQRKSKIEIRNELDQIIPPLTSQGQNISMGNQRTGIRNVKDVTSSQMAGGGLGKRRNLLIYSAQQSPITHAKDNMRWLNMSGVKQESTMNEDIVGFHSSPVSRGISHFSHQVDGDTSMFVMRND